MSLKLKILWITVAYYIVATISSLTMYKMEVAKECGVNYWYVTAPLWMPLAITFGLLSVVMLLLVIYLGVSIRTLKEEGDFYE